MHTGRIAHSSNLPEGHQVVGISDLKASGEMYTETGMQEYSVPFALDKAGIERIIVDHVKAAENAILAGFDGIELHGAHGYLLEQSLNPKVNTRTDSYGGSNENRSRLTLDVVQQIVASIGPDRVGLRISPFLTSNDMPAYDEAEVNQTYIYLATEMNRLGIAYLHLSNNPGIPEKTHLNIREAFYNAIIYCNRLTAETAEAKLQDGSADLVAFGRSFLSNPDFIRRIEKKTP
jgi:N-ethylmaleimide reductase